MEKDFLTAIHNTQGIIYKVCKIYRDSREDQEDLFQEIVYQLWKSFPDFRGDAKLSSWIYRIALNTAMAIYRKPALSIIYYDQLPESIDLPGDEADSENQERLFRVLRNLSDSEKAVIALYLDDYSYQEISAIAGISESNVGVRLNRIKNKLKNLLK